MITKEIDIRFRKLSNDGLSNREIAAALSVSEDTVLRYRRRLGLPSTWARPEPEHGTDARYQRGCHCVLCRQANTTRAMQGRITRYATVQKPSEMTHGLSARINWGCTCEICTSAMRRRNKEHQVEQREWAHRENGRSLESADHHYQWWTSKELDLIEQRELSVGQIAQLLGRTVSAVRNQRAIRRRLIEEDRKRSCGEGNA